MFKSEFPFTRNWTSELPSSTSTDLRQGEGAIDHSNQMVEEIPLELQEPLHSGKIQSG